jgi:hypothetical protein
MVQITKARGKEALKGLLSQLISYCMYLTALQKYRIEFKLV